MGGWGSGLPLHDAMVKIRPKVIDSNRMILIRHYREVLHHIEYIHVFRFRSQLLTKVMERTRDFHYSIRKFNACIS